jgi:hypothetical protein
MRSLIRLAVVVVSILTLTLVAAVGVSAGAGKMGNAQATTASILTGHSELGFLKDAANKVLSNNAKDKDSGECKEPKKTHEDGTPGHEHHPCKDKDKDGDTD